MALTGITQGLTAKDFKPYDWRNSALSNTIVRLKEPYGKVSNQAHTRLVDIQHKNLDKLLESSDLNKVEDWLNVHAFSQKARGYYIRVGAIPGTKQYDSYEEGSNGAFPWVMPKIKGQVFARPCPMRPRHGFVESRPITTYEELERLYHEAKKHDPDVEIMVNPILTGKFSAVATNGGVAFGLGNDGATSGASLLVPSFATPAQWNKAIVSYEYKMPTLGITDTIYMELVENNGAFKIVQKRDGPAQSGEANFIPRRMKVERIINSNSVTEAGKDNEEDWLLIWERLINQAQIKGTVVHLPKQTLSSHYAVHALQRGMAVVTDTKEPEVGSYLSPSTTVPILGISDYRKIAEYLGDWMQKFLPAYGISYGWPAVAATAIASIQAQARWGKARHLMKLRAVGPSMLLRILHAVCRGEMRYWESTGPGNDNRKREPTYEECPVKEVAKGRWDNYRYCLRPMPPADRIKELKLLIRGFEQSGWDGNYGGEKWAKVARQALRLAVAIEAFLHNPRKRTWVEIISAANVAINTVHNSGKSVNKFIRTDQLESISNAASYGFCNAFAAEVVLDLPHTKPLDDPQGRTD